MQPLQSDQAEFKRKNVWIHLDDSTRDLYRNHGADCDSERAVPARVVGIAVKIFIAGDDSQPGVHGDCSAGLKDPVPASFVRSGTGEDGRGPGGKHQDGFRHQEHNLDESCI